MRNLARLLVDGFAAAFLTLVLSAPALAGFESWAPLREYERTAMREGTAFVMTLPTRTGTVEVAFQTQSVESRGYHAEDIDSRGRRKGIGRPMIATYTGVVSPDSGLRDFAKLSHRPGRGKVSGLMRVAGVLYDLDAELERGDLLLMIREITPEELGEVLAGCGVHFDEEVILGASVGEESSALPPATAAAGALGEIELGTEADALFVSQKGSVTAANAAILSIVNAVNGIYEADLGLTNRVVVQRGWSGSDPYTSSDSGILLNEFRTEFSRDVASVYDDAQLFSGRDFESSVVGRAWLSSACGGYRYGVNQYYNQSDSLTRLIMAHEEGHNLGANHTDSGLMAPSINSSVTWFNDVSKSEIGNFVASVSCIELAGGGSPPILDPLGPQTTTEGTMLALQLSASDPDGDPLTFGATPIPEGGSMTPAGLFEYMPPSDLASCGGSATQEIEFFVTDSNGNRVSEIVPITVLDGPGGTAPVLADPADRSVQPGQTVTIQLSASDADGDTLGYTASGLPATASFGAASGQFQWTPAATDAGLHSVVFTATDCSGRSSQAQDVAINVLPPAPAPHLDALSPSSGPARSEVQISGSGFAGTSVQVSFGSKSAPLLSASDTLLVVRAPKQRKGVTAVSVSVLRDGKVSDNAIPFTYTSGGGGGGGDGKGGGPKRR